MYMYMDIIFEHLRQSKPIFVEPPLKGGGDLILYKRSRPYDQDGRRALIRLWLRESSDHLKENSCSLG